MNVKEQYLQSIAKLIGDPVRAMILWTLLDGKAYTATELAAFADTSLPNISMHLNKLTQAEWLSMEKQGRHRYFRFSREEVAYAIEGLTNLLPVTAGKPGEGKKAMDGIKYCRTCYDHLAGSIGVMITEELLQKKLIRMGEDNLFKLTTPGKSFFHDLRIDTDALQKKRRLFARPCLDWTERKYHLAGSLGAALLDKMLEEDWIRRVKHSREMLITANGRKAFSHTFNIEV